jgi:hypothetical protein
MVTKAVAIESIIVEVAQRVRALQGAGMVDADRLAILVTPEEWDLLAKSMHLTCWGDQPTSSIVELRYLGVPVIKNGSTMK